MLRLRPLNPDAREAAIPIADVIFRAGKSRNLAAAAAAPSPAQIPVRTHSLRARAGGVEIALLSRHTISAPTIKDNRSSLPVVGRICASASRLDATGPPGWTKASAC